MCQRITVYTRLLLTRYLERISPEETRRFLQNLYDFFYVQGNGISADFANM